MHRNQEQQDSQRWVDLVARMVSAWNRGWDCSRDPGHTEMSRVVDEAEMALSDATMGGKPASRAEGDS